MWKKKTKLCTCPRPSARFRALLNSLLLRLPRSRARPQRNPTLAGAARPLARPLAAESLRWNPIHFFFQGLFRKSAAEQNTLPEFYHLWIAAEITCGVRTRQFPLVLVFADEVFHSAYLAAPLGVFVRTAYGWNISEPRYF